MCIYRSIFIFLHDASSSLHPLPQVLGARVSLTPTIPLVFILSRLHRVTRKHRLFIVLNYRLFLALLNSLLSGFSRRRVVVRLRYRHGACVSHPALQYCFSNAFHLLSS